MTDKLNNSPTLGIDYSLLPLQIELVPKTAFGENLRKLLTQNEWDKIRKAVYQRANYKCEICGEQGNKHPVEAHEEWIYHENGIQELAQIRALCPNCHLCKHVGFAIQNNQKARVLSHLCKVNGLTLEQANEQIRQAFVIWSKRSLRQWQLDSKRINEVKEWVVKQPK
jgi:hypothetical protein